MAKRKKKKPFKPMEITQVKLNPEQAVLSCCDGVDRDIVQPTLQCEGGGICGWGEEASLAS